MAAVFERSTERGRHVVVLAQDEARRRRHDAHPLSSMRRVGAGT
jgi:hypothetical protein